MTYLEEALAETVAQLRVNGLHGLMTGIRLPIANGYIALQQLACEGAAIGRCGRFEPTPDHAKAASGLSIRQADLAVLDAAFLRADQPTASTSSTPPPAPILDPGGVVRPDSSSPFRKADRSNSSNTWGTRAFFPVT
jgi:hypothetical protein